MENTYMVIIVQVTRKDAEKQIIISLRFKYEWDRSVCSGPEFEKENIVCNNNINPQDNESPYFWICDDNGETNFSYGDVNRLNRRRNHKIHRALQAEMGWKEEQQLLCRGQAGVVRELQVANI